MSGRAISMAAVILWGMASASPAAADQASVSRVGDFGSVLAVAAPDDFPMRSLMRADCALLTRVERPDGSAVETEVCTLSDEPVMVPEFQGVAPDRAFLLEGGPCEWTSDYWWYTADTPVYADSYSYVVTPSGMVRATSTYPAVPLDCG